jgi:hypothetical protein
MCSVARRGFRKATLLFATIRGHFPLASKFVMCMCAGKPLSREELKEKLHRKLEVSRQPQTTA